LKKEDDLIVFENGRRPKKIMQPKTMKSKKGNIFEDGRQPSFVLKRKTTPKK
jgi:hypothetical protein